MQTRDCQKAVIIYQTHYTASLFPTYQPHQTPNTSCKLYRIWAEKLKKRVWVESGINEQKKRRTLLSCWGRLVQNFTILLFYDVSHYDRYHRNQALCKQFKHNLLIVFLYCFALEAKYVPCSVKNWHSLHFFHLYDELRVSLLNL